MTVMLLRKGSPKFIHLLKIKISPIQELKKPVTRKEIKNGKIDPNLRNGKKKKNLYNK